MRKIIYTKTQSLFAVIREWLESLNAASVLHIALGTVLFSPQMFNEMCDHKIGVWGQ